MPSKSPSATTLPSPLNPIEPAFINAFPVNRFGGKGQIAIAGEMKRFVAQNTAEGIASLRRFPGRPENIIRVVRLSVLEQLELEVFAQCLVPRTMTHFVAVQSLLPLPHPDVGLI